MTISIGSDRAVCRPNQNEERDGSEDRWSFLLAAYLNTIIMCADRQYTSRKTPCLVRGLPLNLGQAVHVQPPHRRKK